MLPRTFEWPAAVLLVLGGALTCFAGYRLFRLVLVLYGFIFGALMASSAVGPTNTIGMVAAAIIGGVVGAVILTFAYYVGIGLVGAGLAALATHLVWNALSRSGDPPTVVIVLAGVIGAGIAMVMQRYVIIVGTAFGGAWTMIVGALVLSGDRAAAAATAAHDVWILYPLNPSPGAQWVPIAWIALGLIGTLVQLGVTGRK
jgi:hypothetical protein